MRKNKTIKLKIKLKNNIYHGMSYYPNKDKDKWYYIKQYNRERCIRLTL